MDNDQQRDCREEAWRRAEAALQQCAWCSRGLICPHRNYSTVSANPGDLGPIGHS